MNFAKPNNERIRLFLLAGITAALELLALPRFASELLSQSAHWPIWGHLLAISAPRLLLMFVLVIVLGPFRHRRLFFAYAALYGLLLFVRFWQTEVYVNWEHIVAGVRATLPYFAGMVGIVVGFMVRRSDVELGDAQQ